jgi:hypothetical protein
MRWRNRAGRAPGAKHEGVTSTGSSNRGCLSFSLRQLLIFTAICAIALTAWIWLIRWPGVTLSGAEVRKPYTIDFETNQDPYAIELRVLGKIDGQASITDASGSTTNIGPGDVYLYYFDEYNMKEGTIKYSPGTARSGTLTIQYDIVYE